LHLKIADGRLRSVAVRFGRVQRAENIGIIERREHESLRDMHAFIEEDAGDAAGDFRGDCGAAARGDVAAGVQQRGSIAADFLGGGHFDFRLAMSEAEPATRNEQASAQNCGEQAEGFALAAAAALAIADTQRAEIVFWSL